MRVRVAGILVHNKKVLLMHRIKWKLDYYILPGGGVEEGESLEVALIREMKEETSLDISVGKKVFEYMNNENFEHYFLVYGEGEVMLGYPEKERQSEHNQYLLEWIEKKDIDTLHLLPNILKDILKKLL